MPCTTHHYSCECREERVRDMCRYLLWGARHPDEFYDMAGIATGIARELYPDEGRDRNPEPVGR